MAKRINVKLILQLHESGLSQNKIASTRHLSKTSINTVLKIAKKLGIDYSGIKNMDEMETYHLFFPDKALPEDIYELPDYEYVHKELKRVGVTLKLLWNEYQDSCKKSNSLAIGYSKFCDDYSKFVKAQELTNHLEHKPGNRCKVDWAI